MNSAIWLTWEIHRRNRTISDELNIKLFELNTNWLSLFKYIQLLFKTYKVLIQENSKIIFAQNPSLILSLFVTFYCNITKRVVVIDAHNVGIFFEHKKRLMKKIGQKLNDLIIKNANLILITNDNLGKYVKSKGGISFTLPDPFPKFTKCDKISLKGKRNVFYICSFSSDEPFQEVFEAAKYLDKNTVIYVSGNFNGKIHKNNLPSNIILTGFIDESNYINFLNSVDVIMDLTTRDNCLVCGAYEGISVEKPLILSDTKVLKNYFSGSALYTNNKAADIALKINEALENRDKLVEEVKKIKEIRLKEWIKRKNNLINMLNKKLF
ncbi:MAG: hypothetical protein ACTSPW_13045 [Promethearchaeota archaeon]